VTLTAAIAGIAGSRWHGDEQVAATATTPVRKLASSVPVMALPASRQSGMPARQEPRRALAGQTPVRSDGILTGRGDIRGRKEPRCSSTTPGSTVD
jgi:hypothetical protein